MGDVSNYVRVRHEIQNALRELDAVMTAEDNTSDAVGCAELALQRALGALAQQPAAVDGAVVGQASGFIEFDYSDDDNCACCPGKHAYCRRVKWDGQSAKDMVDEFARKHANEGKRVLVTLTVAGQQGGEP